MATARKELEKLKAEERRQILCKELATHLGRVNLRALPKAIASKLQKTSFGTADRVVLEVEPGIVVPLVLLLPPRLPESKSPVVVCISQEGKEAFLHREAAEIAELLRNGVAVCLPDLRGTGETRPAGDARGAPPAAW